MLESQLKWTIRKVPHSLIALAVLFFAGTSLAFAADSTEWESLAKGQVVIKQNTTPANAVPSVEAKILVSKPMEKVWPVVADPEKLMKNEDKVKKVKVLSRTGNKQTVAFSVVMTRLFPAFDYVLLQELSPPSLLQFHRISGSFKDIQGFWRLTPADGGKKTILAYMLKLDPGPFIPRPLLLTAVKGDLPNMMRNAKATIEKSAY